MHGKDAAKERGLLSSFRRIKKPKTERLDSYFGFWGDKCTSEKKNDVHPPERFKFYATLTRHYYSLVTDFYEYGWSISFHFCRLCKNESFSQAIARHEHYIALHAGIREGETVLDVGCGVGGPDCQISVFTGANIVGLNNNDYQIQRAKYYSEKKGLSDKLKFIKGDFMQMPFPENSFDKIYSIEATIHAPSLEGVYSEIYRVLKPGGLYASYEWVMLTEYDENDPEHQQIVYGIEIGDSIPKISKIGEAEAALIKVGFEIIHSEELSTKNSPLPWYYYLDGYLKRVRSFRDFISIARMTTIGKWLISSFIGLMEFIGLLPKGSKKVNDILLVAADSLVKAGKKEIFTPMQLWVCRKPLV
uniref:Sterol 24-C-methyltransferase n=1 Tax=Pneumocystis carinii TaxID=4754 RepID=Q9C439_PNECA|nr:sterol methyl transferase [Pneumocystis carinii]